MKRPSRTTKGMTRRRASCSVPFKRMMMLRARFSVPAAANGQATMAQEFQRSAATAMARLSEQVEEPAKVERVVVEAVSDLGFVMSSVDRRMAAIGELSLLDFCLSRPVSFKCGLSFTSNV